MYGIENHLKNKYMYFQRLMTMSHENSKNSDQCPVLLYLVHIKSMVNTAIWVVEFSSGVYKKKSTYPKEIIDF
jgi:hypothetical protein